MTESREQREAVRCIERSIGQGRSAYWRAERGQEGSTLDLLIQAKHQPSAEASAGETQEGEGGETWWLS